MRWKSWGAVALLAALCAAVVIVLAGTYTASQQAPEFYTEALALDTADQAEAAEEMGSRVTMLYNQVRRAGSWNALFTAEQINAWLAVDLEQNHPELLPANVKEPRVQIHDGSVTVAARISGETFSTIFTLTLEPSLYEPNVVAFRIQRARAGLLPIPLNDVLREVTNAVENLGLPLSWIQVDGDPVALVTLTPQRDREENVRWLDQLEVQQGEIYVAGRTTPSGDVAERSSDAMPHSLEELALLPATEDALATGGRIFPKLPGLESPTRVARANQRQRKPQDESAQETNSQN